MPESGAPSTPEAECLLVSRSRPLHAATIPRKCSAAVQVGRIWRKVSGVTRAARRSYVRIHLVKPQAASMHRAPWETLTTA